MSPIPADSTIPGSSLTCPVCPLPDWGILKVSGEDAARFLQGQATSDVLALNPGATGCGAFCTPKGRVLANFRMARGHHAVYLFLARELVEPLLKRLQLYILRARVKLEDLTRHTRLHALLGPISDDSLAALGGIAPADLPTAWNEWPGLGVLKLERGTTADYWLVTGADDDRPHWETLTTEAPETWRLRDIEAGFPLILAATREEFLPQMLNLDCLGGTSFSKGCYTGQEIVTRTHFLGQIKRRMFRLTCAAAEIELTPGMAVIDTGGDTPKTAGQIVNACRQASGVSECLAVLGLEYTNSPHLHAGSGEGPRLSGLPLPYPLESGGNSPAVEKSGR